MKLLGRIPIGPVNGTDGSGKLAGLPSAEPEGERMKSAAIAGDGRSWASGRRITVTSIPTMLQDLQRPQRYSRTDLVNRAITIYEFFDNDQLWETVDGQSLVRRRRDELIDDLRSGSATSRSSVRRPDLQPILKQSAGHAFISYAREDSAEADWLQRRLEAAGIRVWRDTEELWPG